MVISSVDVSTACSPFSLGRWAAEKLAEKRKEELETGLAETPLLRSVHLGSAGSESEGGSTQNLYSNSLRKRCIAIPQGATKGVKSTLDPPVCGVLLSIYRETT